LPAHDLNLIEDSIRGAGAIARDFAAKGFETKRKSDGSPVTEADIAVNAFLKGALRSARPDYAWLSEESEDDNSRFAAHRVFVVDPIDGTSAFVKGKPEFTVSVAVVENGLAVSGGVYNPMTDECFLAAAGHGAYLNGARITVSDADALEGCRLEASKTTLTSPRWLQPWPEMHVENPNSIAYRVSQVAAGRFDAAITMAGLHDWDLAAADVIIREAGGALTSLEGAVPQYNRKTVFQPSALAAGPKLHAILRSRLDNAPTHEGRRP
jgi:myo-inositol-1(or 4)-monophosphatase